MKRSLSLLSIAIAWLTLALCAGADLPSGLWQAPKSEAPTREPRLAHQAQHVERDASLSAATAQLPMPAHAPRVRSLTPGLSDLLARLTFRAPLAQLGAPAAEGGKHSFRPAASARFDRHLPRSDCDEPAPLTAAG